MAADILMAFDPDTLERDIQYKNGDLVREYGLGTAVLISLFTDRRADPDDDIDDPNDRRGWWGDLVPDRGDKIGSKLWQFDRSKTDQVTLLGIKKAIEDCLEWMINDGIARKIEVELIKFGDVSNYRLLATIRIHRKYGGVESINFDDLWEAQLGE